MAKTQKANGKCPAENFNELPKTRDSKNWLNLQRFEKYNVFFCKKKNIMFPKEKSISLTINSSSSLCNGIQDIKYFYVYCRCEYFDWQKYMSLPLDALKTQCGCMQILIVCAHGSDLLSRVVGRCIGQWIY